MTGGRRDHGRDQGEGRCGGDCDADHSSLMCSRSSLRPLNVLVCA
jgi:hypothetical protein